MNLNSYGGAMTEGRERVARVYDRIAPFYDWYEAPMDRFGGRDRRARLVGEAHGEVLEVGVGTGRNLELYPPGSRVTAIDVSERMLEQARNRAAELDRPVELRWADVEEGGRTHLDLRPDKVTRGLTGDVGKQCRPLPPDRPHHRNH